jgi:conjugal transfer/entry exclusion protein
MSTTSLKLPDDVKQLAIAAAKHQGISTHAFMVDAIRAVATAADRRAVFVAEALAARTDFLRTGKGYDASEVHNYIRARAQGKKAARPKAKSWRV